MSGLLRRRMSDDPRVPIVCQACETEATVPLDGLADSLDRHNDRFHDGREEARVDPAVADELADLIAEDLGLLDSS